MDRSKLQTYASLAEVVSALAIVISLLYVGYEVRRASTLSSRDADVVLFERGSAANRMLVEIPGLADLVIAADTAPDALSPPDRLRYLAFQHDFFDHWEIAWYYHADGILDDGVWLEWDAWFTAQARDRPAFAWTENRKHFTGSGFRDHVDRALVAR